MATFLQRRRADQYYPNISDNTYARLGDIKDVYSDTVTVTGALSGGAKVVNITADATYTLTTRMTGTTFVLSKADGITFTLPPAVVGLTYKFFVSTSVTSNNYGIDTDGTDNFEGLVINIDKDQAYDSASALQVICKPAGTATHIDLNGGTTGGLTGSWLEITAITADRWFVTGMLHGDSNVITCFS